MEDADLILLFPSAMLRGADAVVFVVVVVVFCLEL
jgi:hypothetical protein